MTADERAVRASFDDTTVVVYQAYGPQIAVPAAAAGRFPDWYNRGRMTWIKPAFLWMMYRSGWATKPGQERVLAVRLHRHGFEWALAHAALSHFDPGVHADRAAWRNSLTAPVRIQWDPDRDLHLRPVPRRAIQIGLSGEAVARYVEEWILDIQDITELAHRISHLVAAGDLDAAQHLLPAERRYPLPPALARTIGATVATRAGIVAGDEGRPDRKRRA